MSWVLGNVLVGMSKEDEVAFKFEKLEVWELALEYVDLVYDLATALPSDEKYNLASQIKRAATSVALNIAEGSTGQTNAEQARFLGMAIRSLVETIACLHIIQRREMVQDRESMRTIYRHADKLTAKLQRFRQSIAPEQKWLREQSIDYTTNSTNE